MYVVFALTLLFSGINSFLFPRVFVSDSMITFVPPNNVKGLKFITKYYIMT